nr:AraC family transcriptional regulator [Amylibacter sp.]
MSFHPRMYAKVTGIESSGPMRSFATQDMLVDCWRVQMRTGARGQYVSMHPRLIMFLDGAQMCLTSERGLEGTPCTVCYVPAGMNLWGSFAEVGPLRHLDIHIKRSTLETLLSEDTPCDAPIFAEATDAVIALSEQIMAYALEDTATPQGIAAKARQLLHTVFTSCATVDWFAQVIDHIDGHLETALQTDTLAAVAGLSRTRFNAWFRARTGQSPHQWVLHARVTRAKELLLQDQPLVEVAARTGFSDQAHLNRVFKRITGTPPGLWCSRQKSAAA